MHRALWIQEILLDIFGHCEVPMLGLTTTDRPLLASLARTCRAFEEPALDLLWEELYDLSPLTRCLPEACHQLSQGKRERSFSRLLTLTEWDILRGYTRRIRIIGKFGCGLDKKSIRVLSNPPTAEPLFPNLRNLTCDYTDIQSTPLLNLPFPSLIYLEFMHEDLHWFQDSLRSFSEFSDIRDLYLLGQSDFTFNKLVSSCICRWGNLQIVHCPAISLDVDALAHLSRMPALTQLSFKQIVVLPDCHSTLSFSNLLRLVLLQHPSLGPISHLLSWIRLPVIKHFIAEFHSCPSRRDLTSFFAGIQTSNTGHTMINLSLNHLGPACDIVHSEVPALLLADLQPCMAFSNLHQIYLNLEWNVCLTDSDVLEMASAWPDLKQLEINPDWGWNTLVGVTPNGLVRLLQKCRSLRTVALAMDTRGYTELPPTGANLALRLPRSFHLNVLDSVIEAESVQAVAAFFTAIEPPPDFHLRAWSSRVTVRRLGWEPYKDRWDDIFRRVKDAVS